MTDSAWAELYLIAGLMVLSAVISTVSIYFFMRTYYREKAQSETEREVNRKAKEQAERDET